MATARKISNSGRPSEISDERSEIVEHYPEFQRIMHDREREILDRVDLERSQIDEQIMTSPGDVGDASVLDASADYYLSLADRDRTELMEIRDAFDRMRRGVYGICENCENEISVQRLKRLPYARLCIDCQSTLEAGRTAARLQRIPKL